MNLTPTIAPHMTAAISAQLTGPIALWARKGTKQRPKQLRAFGYAWVSLILISAVSAVFIRDYRLPNINGYTAIHLLAIAIFVSLLVAFFTFYSKAIS